MNVGPVDVICYREKQSRLANSVDMTNVANVIRKNVRKTIIVRRSARILAIYVELKNLVNWNAMANLVTVTTQLVIAKMDLLSLIVQVCNKSYIAFIIETILYRSLFHKLEY